MKKRPIREIAGTLEAAKLTIWYSLIKRRKALLSSETSNSLDDHRRLKQINTNLLLVKKTLLYNIKNKKM